MKSGTETSKVQPKTGERDRPRRSSKAKGRDYTDPHRHGTKASGGPIERRYVEPSHRGTVVDE